MKVDGCSDSIQRSFGNEALWV